MLDSVIPTGYSQGGASFSTKPSSLREIQIGCIRTICQFHNSNGFSDSTHKCVPHTMAIGDRRYGGDLPQRIKIGSYIQGEIMKKLSFLCIIFILLCTTLLGNTLTENRFHAFYSVSVASQTDEMEEFDSKTGFLNFGLSYWISSFHPSIIIEPGIRLSSKGAKYTESYDGERLKYHHSLLYLDLFNKIKLNPLSVPFYPYLGLSASVLLKAEATYDFTIPGEDIPKLSVDMKEYFENLDLGLLFGADIQMNNRLTLGFEYNLGLVDVLTDIDDMVFKAKNNTMFFTIGVLF